MTKLTWEDTSQHLYETGTSKTVLYPKTGSSYETGVAWNGVTAISESPSGAEETKLYADDRKYLSMRSAEEYGSTIEAYTYPDEWAECDGSAALVNGFNGISVGQQSRKSFGFCYRTVLGNADDGDKHGYKLHLVYNAQAAPSQKSYSTINDSPEAITFSWEITTTPSSFNTDLKPFACLTIDSTKIDPNILSQIEAKLYGTENTDPELMLPSEIIALVGSASSSSSSAGGGGSATTG